MSPFRVTALTPLLLAAVLGLCPLLSGCKTLRQYIPMVKQDSVKEERAALRAQLAPHLDVLGARNWIVVADPAYPILAGEGVDVLTVDANSADTLREVLACLEAEGALTPRLWLCSELEVLTEQRAPGVRRYRRELGKLTARHLHYEVTDRIVALQLAQAAQTYRILYIKTNTALPYSSVAIELDSGYWDSDDEAELRERLEKLNAPATPKPLPQIDSSNYTNPAA